MKDVTIITYVLDDDREELELLEPFLKKICGCTFSLHDNVEDFLQAIEQGAHIAIIDYKLNGKVDGIEVGRKVLEKNSLCYMIMYSGNDDNKIVRRAMNSGFRFFVDKNDPEAFPQIASEVTKQLDAIRSRIAVFQKWQHTLDRIVNNKSKTLEQPV
jgi:FixJ family two-component response regulator